MSTILINMSLKKKQSLVSHLKKHGIQTMPFFTPISLQPAYKTKEKFPNSQKLFEQGLVLPSSINLTSKEIGFISEKINSFFKK